MSSSRAKGLNSQVAILQSPTHNHRPNAADVLSVTNRSINISIALKGVTALKRRNNGRWVGKVLADLFYVSIIFSLYSITKGWYLWRTTFIFMPCFSFPPAPPPIPRPPDCRPFQSSLSLQSPDFHFIFIFRFISCPLQPLFLGTEFLLFHFISYFFHPQCQISNCLGI